MMARGLKEVCPVVSSASSVTGVGRETTKGRLRAAVAVGKGATSVIIIGICPSMLPSAAWARPRLWRAWRA